MLLDPGRLTIERYKIQYYTHETEKPWSNESETRSAYNMYVEHAIFYVIKATDETDDELGVT